MADLSAGAARYRKFHHRKWMNPSWFLVDWNHENTLGHNTRSMGWFCTRLSVRCDRPCLWSKLTSNHKVWEVQLQKCKRSRKSTWQDYVSKVRTCFRIWSNVILRRISLLPTESNHKVLVGVVVNSVFALALIWWVLDVGAACDVVLIVVDCLRTTRQLRERVWTLIGGSWKNDRLCWGSKDATDEGGECDECRCNHSDKSWMWWRSMSQLKNVKKRRLQDSYIYMSSQYIETVRSARMNVQESALRRTLRQEKRNQSMSFRL